MLTAEKIIELLKLEPLAIEGGYFCETYRCPLTLPGSSLPDAYTGERSFSTAIYYLLTPDNFSLMHQVPGEEVFHFYLGDAVEMLHLNQDGTGEVVTMGTDIEAGMHPQVVVPGGVWQGARLVSGGRYALMGTTMAPGFDYADYTNGVRADLCSQYPDYAELITERT